MAKEQMTEIEAAILQLIIGIVTQTVIILT